MQKISNSIFFRFIKILYLNLLLCMIGEREKSKAGDGHRLKAVDHFLVKIGFNWFWVLHLHVVKQTQDTYNGSTILYIFCRCKTLWFTHKKNSHACLYFYGLLFYLSVCLSCLFSLLFIDSLYSLPLSFCSNLFGLVQINRCNFFCKCIK